jgi:alpha-L-rhamnosidase
MSQDSSVKVTNVQMEHLTHGLGIGVDRPRLSWRVDTDIPGWMQSAYEIEAVDAAGDQRGTTGRVESGDSVLVDWPFAPLRSRERVSVRVRVWGTDGSETPWGDLFTVEAALLDAADWTARFITPAAQAHPSPLLRKEFTLQPGIQEARLYITALGVYEAEINGQPVHDHVMAPGWTSYAHRLRYQVCDVTALLREGGNAIGAQIGEGWFRGRLGFGGGRSNIYGDRLALLAQLEVTYADGSTQRVISDESWRASSGAVLESGVYDGEIYDARLEKMGWTEPGFDEGASNGGAGWEGVQTVDWDLNTLFAPVGPPVRRTQEIAPVSIFTSPSGRTLVDFGQNLVGRLRISVSGPAGQTITLRHAEVLEHGELGTRPLRYAKATDRYTLKGEGIEQWEPRFTFHGFRYAEIEGWPGELSAGDISAVVCHTDMERTGWFECSDPLLNRLHENVVWSMRGNFFDIPTDCPQRDERLGWTGDIQVFSPTAAYLYDCSGFLASWLRDLAVEQEPNGMVPYVVPNVLERSKPPAAAWGDAAAFIPWVFYQRFGDLQVLAAQYESMRAWVDLEASIAGERYLWDSGFQFGDWLDPAAPPNNPAAARTPSCIVATAYFARSAEIVGQAAGVLGKTDDEARYLELAEKVRAAFNNDYVTPAGRMVSDSSTAYALALQFALLPTEGQRRYAGQRLAELARAGGYRVSTGFVGTPLICDALSSVGQLEVAYRLLTAKENPSWLYPVTMGATTIWERWDSMLPDGSINTGEMTSFNHYALGAVADWMHRVIGGLAPAEPGYCRIEFRPQPGRGVCSASASHLTPYGLAACEWTLDGEQMHLEIVVPANTRASVTLPGKPGDKPFEVGSGKYAWDYAAPELAAKPPA